MIPGIGGGVDTGGGSLDAGSSASSESGDFFGGNRNFTFGGTTINKSPDTKTMLIYAGLAIGAYLIIKKVK